MCWFLGEGKTGIPEEKPLGALGRESTTLIQPTHDADSGNRTNPHW